MTTIDLAGAPLAATDAFYDSVERAEAVLREVDFAKAPVPDAPRDVPRAGWRPAFAIGGLVVATAALLSRTAF